MELLRANGDASLLLAQLLSFQKLPIWDDVCHVGSFWSGLELVRVAAETAEVGRLIIVRRPRVSTQLLRLCGLLTGLLRLLESIGWRIIETGLWGTLIAATLNLLHLRGRIPQ